jgi:hypothetical protein
MTGQTIALGYGRINFSGMAASYAALKVVPPFMRSSAATSGQARGSRRWTPAGEHTFNEGITNVSVEHPNGTVVLLQVQWKSGGIPLRDGALFLRLRHGAALYSVTAKVPRNRENIMGDSCQMFSGYADILGADDFQALNLKVPDSFLHKFMSEEELAECFDITMMSRETVPRPGLALISTPTGTEMREIAQEPVRRFVFRGRK